MTTANDRPKTDYYWKCVAEAEVAGKMANMTGNRAYRRQERELSARAKRAARMMGRAA